MKKEKKDKSSKKIEELREMLQRTQADFINYKNRVEKETKQYIEYCEADLIRNLLPILDNFELALKNTDDHEKFVDGMEMIYSQLFDILKQRGLEKIECVDKKFDPYLHEVLMKVKSDKPEDTIIEELQKGYKLKDRVLRHAKVKVSG